MYLYVLMTPFRHEVLTHEDEATFYQNDHGLAEIRVEEPNRFKIYINTLNRGLSPDEQAQVAVAYWANDSKRSIHSLIRLPDEYDLPVYRFETSNFVTETNSRP